jgi:hypothetical protein
LSDKKPEHIIAELKEQLTQIRAVSKSLPLEISLCVDELMHEMDGNLNKLNFHFGKDPATILPK